MTNILIVMTDQQRADLRRGEGYPLDTMPFLDRFASEGVDFGRAYTANPICMAARVSLFTGRYPSAHQVRTNHNQSDVRYTRDLLDVLKDAGYRTALCGKNHSHRASEDFDFYECFGHLGYKGETNRTDAEREFADFLCATNHMESHVLSPGGIEVQHPYRSVTDALRFIDSCPKTRLGSRGSPLPNRTIHIRFPNRISTCFRRNLFRLFMRERNASVKKVPGGHGCAGHGSGYSETTSNPAFFGRAPIITGCCA